MNKERRKDLNAIKEMIEIVLNNSTELTQIRLKLRVSFDALETIIVQEKEAYNRDNNGPYSSTTLNNYELLVESKEIIENTLKNFEEYDIAEILNKAEEALEILEEIY